MAQAADVVQTVDVPDEMLDQLRAIVSRICRHDIMANTGVRSEAMATAQALATSIDLHAVLHTIVTEALPEVVKIRVSDEALERNAQMDDEDLANSLDPYGTRATEQILDRERKRQRKVERELHSLALPPSVIGREPGA